MNELLRSVTQSQLRTDIPEFGSGDTVRVHAKVVEGTRERIQVFEGVVMRKRAGGIEANFTVRRVASHGIGVERTFMINSPRIDKIEVTRFGEVRRARLYYLRGLTGRAARIRERRRPEGTLHIRANVTAASVQAPVEPVVEETTVEATGEE